MWEADSVETMWQAKWCQRCHWHSRRQRSMCMRMSMMWRSIAVCMTSQIRRFQIASHYGFGWVQSQFWLFIGSYAKRKRERKKRVKIGVRNLGRDFKIKVMENDENSAFRWRDIDKIKTKKWKPCSLCAARFAVLWMQFWAFMSPRLRHANACLFAVNIFSEMTASCCSCRVLLHFCHHRHSLCGQIWTK